MALYVKFMTMRRSRADRLYRQFHVIVPRTIQHMLLRKYRRSFSSLDDPLMLDVADIVFELTNGGNASTLKPAQSRLQRQHTTLEETAEREAPATAHADAAAPAGPAVEAGAEWDGAAGVSVQMPSGALDMHELAAKLNQLADSTNPLEKRTFRVCATRAMVTQWHSSPCCVAPPVDDDGGDNSASRDECRGPRHWRLRGCGEEGAQADSCRAGRHSAWQSRV